MSEELKTDLEEEEVIVNDEDQDQETPLFMQEEDEQESSTDGVPVATHVTMKQKLKGKIREGNEELERLRAENAQLKQSSAPPVIEAVKRPKLDDFDTDEEYDVALEKYEDDRAQKVYNAVQAKDKSEATVRKFQERVDASVDDHAERVDQLIKKHSISPEVYVQANETFKDAVEDIVPGTFEFFIHLMGKGSDKTVFAMGNNKTKLAVLKEKLRDETKGLAAAFYLGEESARLNGVKTKTSQAPAPPAEIKGDAPNRADAKIEKKWNKLVEDGKVSEAFSLMRKAKKEGVDTKQWVK